MTLRAVAAAILAVSVAACGSTIAGSHASSSELQAPGTSGNAPGAAGGSAGSTTGGPGATATGSAAGLGGSQAGAGSTGTAGSSATAAGPAAVSANAPISVGIGVDGNDGAFAAAFGVSNSQPSEQAVAAAIVRYLNAHGGLAGHPISPVYGVFDNTSNDWIAQDQTMCTQFTQDKHVAIVVRNDDIFGPLDACLAQAHTPLVLWESVFRQPSWYAQAPGLRFSPDVATGQRTYAALIDREVATKRWTRATKIGLVRYDRNDQAEVQSQAVEPALKRHGLTLTDWEAVHTPESFQDLGTTSSDLASAVLRMRQKGVTDVMFMGGDVSYLFAQEASSQEYNPTYALTSFDFPNGLPSSVLAGAFGVGWDPSDDLLSGLPTTPGQQRCQQAAANTGVDWSATGVDRFYVTCDELFFLQAAYAAGGSVAPGAFAHGVQLLGAGLAPSFTFRVDASKHPDGLGAFRDLTFASGCSCLRYGAQFTLP